MRSASQCRSQSVTTSYVALAALPATRVSISNKTGAALLVRMAAETTAGYELSLDDNDSVVLQVVASSAEVEIKAAAGVAGVYYVVDNLQ